MSQRDESARRRLRAANPLKSEEAPSPASPIGQALLKRITRIPIPETERPFWRRRRALFVLIPAALLACAAGYSLLRKATDPTVVVCFEKTSLSSHRAAVSPQRGDPVAACEPLWEPDRQFNPTGAPRPSLVACVLEEGAIGVFPRLPKEDTCEALGLSPSSSNDEDTEFRAIQAVQEELTPRFLDTCLNRGAAVALVQDSLNRHDLSEWLIADAAPFTVSRPCATLSFDLPKRTVLLVPTSGSP